MAYNQSAQHWPQQRPPPQPNHGSSYNQGAWRDGPRQQQGHGRQMQDAGYNEYAENARGYPLSANDRWLDPGYQDQYNGDAMAITEMSSTNSNTTAAQAPRTMTGPTMRLQDAQATAIYPRALVSVQTSTVQLQ